MGFTLPCSKRPRVSTPARARRLLLRGVTNRERHHEKEPEASLRTLARCDERNVPDRAAADAAVPVRSRISGIRVRTAIVSTYPPRACGIGAFAADVRAALLGRRRCRARRASWSIVNEPSRPQRPGWSSTIAQGVRGDYMRAARILGRLDVDVVLLQHEYGIFGGADGDYVLSLAEELSQPLVVTLHTVLSRPSRHQAAVLSAALRRSGARDRDDGDGEAPAGRVRRLR